MRDSFKNALVSALAFAVLFGGFTVFRFGWEMGVPVGILCGVLFGLSLYVFVNSRAVRKQTRINTQGERVVLEGGANHYVRGEAVGGRLYLLETRLVFKSHHFNLQNHQWELPLNRIRRVFFFAPLGLIPNGLGIETDTGAKERFVVNGRRKWKRVIEAEKGKNKESDGIR